MAQSLKAQSCAPCTSDKDKLSREQVRNFIGRLPNWELSSDGGTITRYVEFKNFAAAFAAVQKIAAIAEKEGHHPDLGLGWGYVDISLTTHAVDGLSMNDFICAAKFDDAVK